MKYQALHQSVNSDMILHLLLLFPLPLAAGIAGFWGVGRALKSGEDTREFRQDWRRWRLPIAEVEATERRRAVAVDQ